MSNSVNIPMQAIVSAATLSLQTPPVYNKDKRSNRRRVSCGFHHKRHQACPENCEGRVTHPPEPHAPFQDKFTVGCSECKAYFQNKVYMINNQQQPQQVQQQVQQVQQQPSFAFYQQQQQQQSQQQNNISKNMNNMKKRIVMLDTTKPIVNLEQPSFESVSPISSSPASSRPLSPVSNGASEVPTFKNSNMTKINLLNLTSKLDHHDLVSNNGQMKRKSPSSPELLFSDDSANSSPIAAFVPSPSQSPTITPRPVSLMMPSPTHCNGAAVSSGSAVAQPSTLVDSSLLMVLEQEAQKELFVQKEQELFGKLKSQKEELDRLERQQQLIDYQKIQQQHEVKRLKRKHDELESLRVKLDQMEKDLRSKEDSMSRRLESLSPSNLFSQQITNNQLPKLHINTNLLKQAATTTDFDFSSSPTSCNSNQQQPIKLSPLLLSSNFDRSPVVPDTNKNVPMSFMHLLNTSQSS
ncbi:prespore-specific protein [Heterostelium album PN500]|uniref:Prespore-specific protein n=1 Tax=Heterostelium pallidum (strain ATCC 26659 / Pp 5 / PN500) TaxID=670386 RepID=D3B1Y8_HETP5|nr:prespore-specific protein [Heterostelium album PN500]EFA85312.1 prespore-specific protein [Heterostelium album PN500]|eukprot:XP_020437421.1 prespore-specific protein [Heterostelium album PN500]